MFYLLLKPTTPKHPDFRGWENACQSAMAYDVAKSYGGLRTFVGMYPFFF